MDVLLISKVITLAENALAMDKTQAQQNFTAFDAIFCLDVNDVKLFKS